jgi:hypothetical protein
VLFFFVSFPLFPLISRVRYAARGDAFDIVDFYNGGCPEPLAGKVALGLFSALSHIHSKGIVGVLGPFLVVFMVIFGVFDGF